jgi:hypothetical protein
VRNRDPSVRSWQRKRREGSEVIEVGSVARPSRVEGEQGRRTQEDGGAIARGAHMSV